MNPETTNEPKGSIARSGLAARLRILEGNYKSQADALRAYGINKNTYKNWITKKSSPSLEAVAQIAKVAGVSLDWLAFGEGQGPDGTKVTSAALCAADSALMSEIYLKIHTLVQDHGQRLSPEQHIALTCDMYNTVMAKPDDREKIISDALRMTATMLKGLMPPEPAEQTPTTKRHA